MQPLLVDFYNSGSPATPSYPTPIYKTGLTEPLLIVNEWNWLQRLLLDANTLITDVTARLSALETGVSSGSLAAFAALRYNQVTVQDRPEIIRQLSEAYSMATAGPALLAAVTAAYLTPIQTAIQNFTTAYQTILHAKGLV